MFSETVVVSMTGPSMIRDEVMPDVQAVDRLLSDGASALSRRLGAGNLKVGLVQGSAFCCGIQYDEAGNIQRALLSPEELTVSMAVKLLEEAPDE
jgi:hypothetical protein